VEFETPGSLYVGYEEDYNYMKKETKARREAGFEAIFTGDIKNPLYEDDAYVGIVTPEDSVMNPYAYSNQLARKLVKDYGVRIFEKSRVTSVDRRNTRCITNHGSIKAKKLALLGQNVPSQFGYSKWQVDLVTFCLATQPLTSNLIKELGLKNRRSFWDTDMPFFYGRLTQDNRLVIGGDDLWQPLTKLNLHETKLDKLERAMKTRIPLLANVDVTHRWGGPFTITSDAMPVIGKDNNIYFAGYAAGISQAVMTGYVVAKLASDEHSEYADIFSYDREISLIPKMYSLSELIHMILGMLAII